VKGGPLTFQETQETTRLFFPQSAFLFGADIVNYLQEIHNKWSETMMFAGGMEDKEGRMVELNEWFYVQAKTGTQEKFAKYLNLKNWK
jgi:hypothetical protein